MAFPTSVNSQMTDAAAPQGGDIVNPQITDAVTQANAKVIGDAPAIAMGTLYQSTAQALALAAHNAVTAQQQANTLLQAATTQGVALLYGIDTASTGAATKVEK